MNTLVAECLLGPDAALPHRDAILDAGAMSLALSAAAHSDLGPLRIRRVKYRPGHSVRAVYEVADGAASPLGPRLISVRGLRGPHGALPLGAMRLDELDAAAWWFPADRKLHRLGEVWLGSRVRTLMGADPNEVPELVAYAPEKSATIRFSGADGDLYAKVCSREDFEPSVRNAIGLHPVLATAGISSPRVVAALESHRVIVQAALQGRPMSAEGLTEGGLAALGTMLAEIHGAKAPDWLPPFTRTAIPAIAGAVETVAMLRPDLRAQVEQLGAALIGGVPTRSPQVLLHGDVHTKNVMVDDGHLAVIDLDQAAVGAPAADLASAIAKLSESGAEAGLVDAFLDGYAERSAVPPERELAWHLAAALLCERVTRAISRVRRDVLTDLERLLDHALRLSEAGR